MDLRFSLRISGFNSFLFSPFPSLGFFQITLLAIVVFSSLSACLCACLVSWNDIRFSLDMELKGSRTRLAMLRLRMSLERPMRMRC